LDDAIFTISKMSCRDFTRTFFTRTFFQNWDFAICEVEMQMTHPKIFMLIRRRSWLQWNISSRYFIRNFSGTWEKKST